MIEFRDVSKVYDSNGTKALNNVNIKIEDGEFVFIVGSSGAGKSTFLKLIMHEEKPSDGVVVVWRLFFGNNKEKAGSILQKNYGNRISGFPSYS